MSQLLVDKYVLVYPDNIAKDMGKKIRWNPTYPLGITTFVNHPKVKRSWMWGSCKDVSSLNVTCEMNIGFEFTDGAICSIKCDDGCTDNDVINITNEFLSTI